jgi:poly(hydroxyalkanoate) granule-associated protein
MGQPEDRTEETNQNTAEQGPSPVLNLLHQVWLAGLGAVSMAGEEAGKLVEQLVEKGKQVEPGVIDRGKKVGEEISDAAEEVGMRLRDVAARVSKRAEAAETMMDERVRAALDRMGYATKEDFEGLSAKLDALMSRLEELGARRGRKPAGEDPVQ